MNKENGTTLVLVTHNLELAQRTQRILRMKGGKLAEDVVNPMTVVGSRKTN
jgi:putative ABC transport system ATP-binding protein